MTGLDSRNGTDPWSCSFTTMRPMTTTTLIIDKKLRLFLSNYREDDRKYFDSVSVNNRTFITFYNLESLKVSYCNRTEHNVYMGVDLLLTPLP